MAGRVWKYGGASRARTDDLIVANDALSQLSYSPTRRRVGFLILAVVRRFRLGAVAKLARPKPAPKGAFITRNLWHA
jgi:hypothetical protein